MTPILSIIIVSWNTCDLLVGCIQSVEAEISHFQPGAVETLVVDNASSDQSVQVLQTRFPWVHLICNDKNTGFAYANNQAIQICKGRYLLLLNPDTKLLPGALAALVQFMDFHPQAGAAGARLLNPDGSLQPSYSPKPTLAREFWRLFHLDVLYPYAVYKTEVGAASTPVQVDVVQGAALITRRDVIEQVGALDTDYYIYSEEVDFCCRVQRAGWKIFWVPEARVIHYGGQSTQQAQTEMFLQLYLAKIIYFRKNHSMTVARIYKCILFLAALARVLVSPLLLRSNSSQRIRHLQLSIFYRRLLVALPNL